MLLILPSDPHGETFRIIPLLYHLKPRWTVPLMASGQRWAKGPIVRSSDTDSIFRLYRPTQSVDFNFWFLYRAIVSVRFKVRFLYRAIVSVHFKVRFLHRAIVSVRFKVRFLYQAIVSVHFKVRFLYRDIASVRFKVRFLYRPIEVCIGRLCRRIQSNERIGIGRSDNRTYKFILKMERFTTEYIKSFKS